MGIQEHRGARVDWVWSSGGTLLGGCMGTFDWAGEVGGHVPRRGDLMLARAGACQKWLLLLLQLCRVWAVSVRNEGSLDRW